MQGFNMGRYVPPDQEGVTTGNKLHGKHALGARARHIAAGALTVRFEMPFAVWCSTCPKPTLIAQGVRFNAEKSRAGRYHTTPIWAFRFRHPACGGTLEIRTDPANTAYVVTEGGRKRDTGDEGRSESLVGSEIRTVREHLDAREGAFANLERTIAHRAQLFDARVRLDELEGASARAWDDPYARNQQLRRAFRVGRKAAEAEAATDEDLKERLSLGIDLVPAREEDARRAALVDFGPEQDAGRGTGPVERALAQPLFAVETKTDDKTRAGKKRKAETAAAKAREGLMSEVVGNTRIARDPFLEGQRTRDVSRGDALLSGLKRKRVWDAEPPDRAPVDEDEQPTAKSAAPVSLVSYDSD